jgi:hypothetical protein
MQRVTQALCQSRRGLLTFAALCLAPFVFVTRARALPCDPDAIAKAACEACNGSQTWCMMEGSAACQCTTICPTTDQQMECLAGINDSCASYGTLWV